MEPPGGEAFVFHAVLRAEHGCSGAGSEFQLGKGRRRVLRLHAQEHNFVASPVDFARMFNGRDRDAVIPVRRAEEQASRLDGPEMFATRDERGFVTSKR